MTIREFTIAFLALAIAGAGAYTFQHARKLPGWRRKSLKIVGLLVVLFAAFQSFSWWARSGSRMPAPVFTIDSPDARFIAKTVEPDGDLIPTHVVRISVRQAGHPFAEEVYAGEEEPNIRWKDNKTLELIYPVQTQEPFCRTAISEVKVVCSEVARDKFKPELRE